MNRPLGVTIIAILSFINGLLGLCVPGLVIIGGGISALFSGGLGLIVVCGGLLLAAGPLAWLLVSYGCVAPTACGHGPGGRAWQPPASPWSASWSISSTARASCNP